MGDAAAWGTAVHQWKERGLLEDVVDPHLRQLLGKRGLGFLTDIRERFWPEGEGLHEVCLRVGPDGVGVAETFTGSQHLRDAWKAAAPEDHVTGTADWLGTYFGEAWVDDLKTGREPPPPDCPQNRIYALGYPSGPVNLSITHWPRYPVTGTPKREWAVLTSRQLEATRRDVSTAYRNHLEARGSLLLGEAPLPVPGDHCDYCPSKPFCPAFTRQEDEDDM